MKNNLIILVSAALLLLLIGCNNDSSGIDNNDITMPTEITQMQEQYGDFDPNTAIETLKNTPIWISEVVVSCIKKNGQLIEARLERDKNGAYSTPGTLHIYVFSDNNVRSLMEPEIPPFKRYYSDYPMQYDPNTQIITTTDFWPYSEARQYEARILAVTNDRIMIEGSIGFPFWTYRGGIQFSYPDTFYREILRAGTQEDLDRWKDAVDIVEFHNRISGSDSE